MRLVDCGLHLRETPWDYPRGTTHPNRAVKDNAGRARRGPIKGCAQHHTPVVVAESKLLVWNGCVHDGTKCSVPESLQGEPWY